MILLHTGKIKTWLLMLVVSVLPYACQPASTVPAEAFRTSEQGKIGVSEHMIVDCLLPGQQRRLGKIVYLTPRRPKRITAAECATRGGEYIIYDRANYKTALKYWLAEAKEDNLEAMTFVGEIYEKGLGTAPDYGAASRWYRKAANKGYARAQINLGHLYELGRGVPRDMAEAIRWYRLGAGLSESLALTGFASGQNESQEVRKLRKEIERLQEQLRKAREELNKAPDRSGAARHSNATIQSLQDRIENLIAQKTRTGRANIPRLPSMAEGSYYGLIIGNNTYDDNRNFPALKTAINDARRIGQVLVDKYQFNKENITLLTDASHMQIFDALAAFEEKLGSKDKFLIYFAGHGYYDEIDDEGYWFPVDAKKKVRALWISNTQITRQINRIQARHILVIADSCYAGTLTDMAILRPKKGMPEKQVRFVAKTLVEKYSRTVLTSGSLTPVISSGGDQNSLFAEILLRILEKNESVITGKDLYNEIFPRVASTAQLLGMAQEPNYGVLRSDLHQAGDFFFIPKTSIARADVILLPRHLEPF